MYFTHYIEINDHEYEVTVHYTPYKAEPMTWNYPGSPAECYINEIVDESNNEITPDHLYYGYLLDEDEYQEMALEDVMSRDGEDL